MEPISSRLAAPSFSKTRARAVHVALRVGRSFLPQNTIYQLRNIDKARLTSSCPQAFSSLLHHQYSGPQTPKPHAIQHHIPQSKHVSYFPRCLAAPSAQFPARDVWPCSPTGCLRTARCRSAATPTKVLFPPSTSAKYPPIPQAGSFANPVHVLSQTPKAAPDAPRSESHAPISTPSLKSWTARICISASRDAETSSASSRSAEMTW